MVLTHEEIVALTGFKRTNAQFRWLRERGWVHETGGDGRPKISRAYAEQKLGVNSEAPAPKREPRLILRHESPAHRR